MKFSIRDLVAEFEGWELTFKKLKIGAYAKFITKTMNIPRDAIVLKDGEASIDTDKFSTAQMIEFSELEEKFLAQNLITAKCENDSCQTLEQKELLCNYLLTIPEFNEWKEGYYNGPKPT